MLNTEAYPQCTKDKQRQQKVGEEEMIKTEVTFGQTLSTQCGFRSSFFSAGGRLLNFRKISFTARGGREVDDVKILPPLGPYKTLQEWSRIEMGLWQKANQKTDQTKRERRERGDLSSILCYTLRSTACVCACTYNNFWSRVGTPKSGTNTENYICQRGRRWRGPYLALFCSPEDPHVVEMSLEDIDAAPHQSLGG